MCVCGIRNLRRQKIDYLLTELSTHICVLERNFSFKFLFSKNITIFTGASDVSRSEFSALSIFRTFIISINL